MLQALLILYASMAFINILLMAFLHFKHNHEGYYLKAIVIWVGLLLGFFMDGVMSSRLGLPSDLFGIIFLSMTTFGFVSLSADIYELRFPLRPFQFILVACWICGFVAHFIFNLPLIVSSSFVAIGITAPTFALIFKIRRKRVPLNVIDKLFLTFVAIESIHLLDYPFLRELEWAHIPGFSLGMFVIFISSVLIPIVINQKIQLNLNRDLVKAKESAEVANKSKSIFLANVSHELRTPMHGILSFANICKTRLRIAPPEELEDYLSEIHDSGSRLMTLLNDLLDLAKLESGKMTYDMQDNDIRVSIDIARSSLSALYKANQIDVAMEYKGELKARFDMERITQVLNNLISNAIKFSYSNTTIKISAQHLEKCIRVSVENKGIGIPSNELEMIFEKFNQSSQTKKKSGGTGLGLSICREIILAHKGSIWAESNSDGLTRFSFDLPLDFSEEHPKSA